MKLIKAHATNYRNIIDSNDVDIGQMTCLVGKNEAGKSAFLRALEGLRSTDATFKDYGKIENYPRRFLADYDERHGEEDAMVMQTYWELDSADVKAVEAELGEGTLKGTKIGVSKRYESETTTWEINVEDEKVIQHLSKKMD